MHEINPAVHRAVRPGRASAARRSRGPVVTGALGLSVLVPATATLGAPALAAQEALPGKAAVKASATRTVTLVTGDQVMVTTTESGQPRVLAVHPASQAAGNGAFLSFQDASGDRYVIPAVAQPYVGRQLDLSLFDVTALAKGTSTSDRVPVTVSFARGAKPSTPTGLTLTSTSGSSAHGASARGYTTAASGRKLARLLKQRIAADVRAGHKPGSTPLFTGVTSVGRTGATTASTPATNGVSTPATKGAAGKYKLNILQITAEDRSGAGVNGAVLVTDTDNAAMMTAVLPVDDGIEKVAVPSGHYSATPPPATAPRTDCRRSDRRVSGGGRVRHAETPARRTRTPPDELPRRRLSSAVSSSGPPSRCRCTAEAGCRSSSRSWGRPGTASTRG